MQLGITMPTRIGPMDRFPEWAELADRAGFDSLWTYEIYRNPYAMLTQVAPRTTNVTLATGLAGAFPRSPFEAANAAADVDEMSDGRMLIGMGTGVPEFLQAFHSQGFEKPVARMRDFIQCMRLSWEYLATGEADDYDGEHYRFIKPPFNPWGLRELPRERIPIYLASLGPVMTRLAGEVADGWMAYLVTPRYIEEHVLPRLAEGAKRAGRDVSDIPIALEVICSVHTNREIAYRRSRIQVGLYCAHPVSDGAVELYGLEAERDAVRHAFMTKGFDGLADTSDKLVDAFSITGTPEEARQKYDQWTTGPISHLILHTPYAPPLAAEESEDCYRYNVEAFSRNTAGAEQAGITLASV